MMSGKHTPGPWRATSIAQGTADYCIHAAGIPWQLAYLAENTKVDWPLEANARLIAAAPDLLDALQGFALTEDRIVAAQGSDMILRVPMAVITAAARAIAKAEG